MKTLANVSLALLLLTAGACGGDDEAPDGTGGAPMTSASTLEGTITVFAAASLTEAFTELATEFEAANEGVDVELNFAGSSALREQILAGAPADVFASADLSNMQAVVDAGLASAPVDFAENQLLIAVPAGNPAGIAGLADFADADLLLGLCAEEVPCGRFGREALDNAGVTPSVDTNEPDVRSLLTKVEEGELDAGIVYRTDVLAAGDAVEGIDIPVDQNVIASYPIAPVTGEGHPAAAAFVAFVISDAGQAILAADGFDEPA